MSTLTVVGILGKTQLGLARPHFTLMRDDYSSDVTSTTTFKLSVNRAASDQRAGNQRISICLLQTSACLVSLVRVTWAEFVIALVAVMEGTGPLRKFPFEAVEGLNVVDGLEKELPFTSLLLGHVSVLFFVRHFG